MDYLSFFYRRLANQAKNPTATIPAAVKADQKLIYGDNFDLSEGTLNTASVDLILQALVNSVDEEGALWSSTAIIPAPSAPPSEAGLANVAILVARGAHITVNS